MEIYIVLILLIIILILLMIYCPSHEFFEDCIIYKDNQMDICNNEIYGNKGQLQLIYDLYAAPNNNDIINIYNLKKKYNIFKESCYINLNKLNRNFDNTNDITEKHKKIVLKKNMESESEWATCYFNENDNTPLNDFKDDIFYLNDKKRILFTNPNPEKTLKNICKNYNKFIETDAPETEFILLKIECNIDSNFDINTMKLPTEINIKNINIIKYNNKTKDVNILTNTNHFIDYFFTIYYDVVNFIYIPLEIKKVSFIKFDIDLCEKISIKEYIEKDNFNIGEFGIFKINILKNPFNNFQQLDDNNIIKNLTDYKVGLIDKNAMFKHIDTKISKLKPKLIKKTKLDYSRCRNNTSYNINNTLKSNCAININKHNESKLNRLGNFKNKKYNCMYTDCNHFNTRCDLYNINQFGKSIKNIHNIDEIYNDENLFKDIKNISDKAFNACKEYEYIDTPFTDSINNIYKFSNDIFDNNFNDGNLNQFNDAFKFKIDLLKFISKDNCIYIQIKSNLKP